MGDPCRTFISPPTASAEPASCPRPTASGKPSFALELLASGGGGPDVERWRRAVGHRPPARRLTELAKVIRPFPDIDRMVQRDHWGGAAPAGARPNRVTEALRHFYHACVAPYWDQIARSLERDRAARLTVLREHGADGLLGSLHPKVHWSAAGLEVPGQAESSLDRVGLNDRPVLLPLARDHRAHPADPAAPRPDAFYPIRSDREPAPAHSALAGALGG
ncbi:Transcriptional regulator OS=Streptomyces rimosus subsp. rimosus (strain ATCC / DSM 40260 /JCM 4667 / NRRL 2234) OX=1265868 GN=SRIM_031055 PE=4 SV=1 [Streptomyces rimosus subsp. rimosus]